MKCPSCGAEASGNFCAACGNPLNSRKCGSCGTVAVAGTRFCTTCGKPLGGGGGQRAKGPAPTAVPTNPNLAWWVAGALLVAVFVAVGYPIVTQNSGPAAGTGAPAGMEGATGGAGLVDLTTMSLEEQGTLLFNRVMRSNAAGDTADVAFFLPKALVIYEQLAPTDPDGLYHYALLYEVGGDFEAALEKAQEGLAQVPDYLLLLAVAAEASEALGDSAGARDFYSHFLRVYDSEMALMRPGYEHHQPIFPSYREEAQIFLGSG